METKRTKMLLAQTNRRDWRYCDLAALPDDSRRHELFDGEHVVSPSPVTFHQVVVWNLVGAMHAYLEHRPVGTALAGPFDIKFSAYTVLVPDLVYFAAERYGAAVNERHATAAPDLVVEVLSPGTRRRDRGRKRAIYDREGVREYWVIDPDSRSVIVLRRAAPDSGLIPLPALTLEAGDAIRSPLFPDLQLPLSKVFAGPRV